MQRLNSTGSFWIDNSGNYWSYSTKMSDYFKHKYFKNCKNEIEYRLTKRKTKQNLEAIKNEVLKRNYLLKLLKDNKE